MSEATAMQARVGEIPDLELTRRVVEQAPDVIIVTDRDGVIRVWNERATAVFGFSAVEAMNAGLDLIIPPGLREAHWKGFHAAMASGKVKSPGRAALTRALHRDGRKLYLELSFGVLGDDAGHAIGSVAIGRDVTDSRRPAADRAGS